MLSIRKAAVAGQFYPGDPLQLQGMISGLLDKADSSEHIKVQPKAIIVPHAGYIYTGLAAASAFVSLLPFRKK
ncbi:MAG: AmmeMemoRadiSam system protein B [Oleiphilaceae bacterium]|jgi:AmmeMemoRadiSam system protein B